MAGARGGLSAYGSSHSHMFDLHLPEMCVCSFWLGVLGSICMRISLEIEIDYGLQKYCPNYCWNTVNLVLKCLFIKCF
jgi:hypothetical protein